MCIRSLGMGLDQKALDAVWKWRFAPGMPERKPSVGARELSRVSFQFVLSLGLLSV